MNEKVRAKEKQDIERDREMELRECKREKA